MLTLSTLLVDLAKLVFEPQNSVRYHLSCMLDEKEALSKEATYLVPPDEDYELHGISFLYDDIQSRNILGIQLHFRSICDDSRNSSDWIGIAPSREAEHMITYGLSGNDSIIRACCAESSIKGLVLHTALGNEYQIGSTNIVSKNDFMIPAKDSVAGLAIILVDNQIQKIGFLSLAKHHDHETDAVKNIHWSVSGPAGCLGSEYFYILPPQDGFKIASIEIACLKTKRSCYITEIHVTYLNVEGERRLVSRKSRSDPHLSGVLSIRKHFNVMPGDRITYVRARATTRIEELEIVTEEDSYKISSSSRTSQQLKLVDPANGFEDREVIGFHGEFGDGCLKQLGLYYAPITTPERNWKVGREKILSCNVSCESGRPFRILPPSEAFKLSKLTFYHTSNLLISLSVKYRSNTGAVFTDGLANPPLDVEQSELDIKRSEIVSTIRLSLQEGTDGAYIRGLAIKLVKPSLEYQRYLMLGEDDNLMRVVTYDIEAPRTLVGFCGKYDDETGRICVLEAIVSERPKRFK
jgi:hypothetical protein